MKPMGAIIIILLIFLNTSPFDCDQTAELYAYPSDFKQNKKNCCSCLPNDECSLTVKSQCGLFWFNQVFFIECCRKNSFFFENIWLNQKSRGWLLLLNWKRKMCRLICANFRLSINTLILNFWFENKNIRSKDMQVTA